LRQVAKAGGIDAKSLRAHSGVARAGGVCGKGQIACAKVVSTRGICAKTITKRNVIDAGSVYIQSAKS
jgi:hypothetical protein